ncbi:hypothetical protein HDU93_008288 [Gonapodya sp. JEL0774]|nr:hypothetical protein HDU93_008288 [Gonapodya sp. JEL0774]
MSWFDTFTPPHANVQRRVRIPQKAGECPFPKADLPPDVSLLPQLWIENSPATTWPDLRPLHTFPNPSDPKVLVPPHSPPKVLTPTQTAFVEGVRQRIFGTGDTPGLLLPEGDDYADVERRFWSDERIRQYCRAVKWVSIDAATKRIETSMDLICHGASRDGVPSTIEQHYPEILGVFHILNASWILRTMMTIASPFLDPVTKSKAHLVADAKAKEEKEGVGVEGFGGTTRLAEHFDLDEVESDLGGTSKFDFDLEAWSVAVRETMTREPKY